MRETRSSARHLKGRLNKMSMQSLGLIALTVLTVVAAPAITRAGPWVRPLGSAYIKAAATVFSSDDSFQQGVAMGLAFESITYRLYAEVGLPFGFALALDLPYVIATNTASTNIEYTNHTIGDTRVRLDYALLPEIPLALSLEAKLPLYDSIGEQGANGIIEVDGTAWSQASFPDVGDGNVDLTASLALGHSFAAVPSWITGELGYQVRTGGFADGLYAALNAGVFVWPEHLALGGYATAIIPLQEDPNPLAQATKEYVYAQGYVLVTAAPLVPDLSLSFAVGGIVHSRNTGAGMDLSAGISYEF